MDKKTEYRAVISTGGFSRQIRPVHLARVDMTRTGTTYHGDPIWSEFWKDVTLCGRKDVISTTAEPNCAKCLKLRHRQVDWNAKSGRVGTMEP